MKKVQCSMCVGVQAICLVQLIGEREREGWLQVYRRNT